MCGGGGAGGSGEQKYMWNDRLEPYWNEVLGQANYFTGLGMGGGPKKEFERYPGERIAGINSDQGAAMGAIRDYVSDPRQSLYGVGNQEFAKTMQGNYLTGAGANPFSAPNAYEGDSPQFRKTMQTGLEDITNAYKQGTAADTTRMFNMAGAFGGSAHQNAVANNEAGLGKTLGNYSDQMLNKQYDRSAGLNESYLNRGSGNYEGERGRMMGAGQASQNDQNLTLQRYNALMGVGDIGRGFTQDQMNLGYQDWQDQQNWSMKQLENMTNIMSRAQGGVSPSMSQTNPGYSASPFSQLLGAGLLGYGAFGGGR